MNSTQRLEQYSSRVEWDDIDSNWVKELIKRARAEDMSGAGFKADPITTFDVSSELLDPKAKGRARLIARQEMSVCGMPLIPLISAIYGDNFTARNSVKDGARLRQGEVLGVLEGTVSAMLSAERVVLNFLQRLSGVATETHRYVEALGPVPTRLLDTRKTTPGWRALEKYAVATGGGWNHRLGLYDRVMLKDNHLAVGGFSGEALADLVKKAKGTYPKLGIEVEVDALEQIPPVLAAGADVIMLDNFDDESLVEAIALIDGKAATEASGGITIERLPRLASLGLDFISTGATVHQAAWVDIGLDWERSAND
jgi:nicotinate-nucleotide pyrophosphorylase (carboxylating)|tara:strand:+ start:602 stop:1537 length:936 start_codon:yes stop_codon:yes gene_type:complete